MIIVKGILDEDHMAPFKSNSHNSFIDVNNPILVTLFKNIIIINNSKVFFKWRGLDYYPLHVFNSTS